MSTRSCTTLHGSDYTNVSRGSRQVSLYRHSDGYPAEAGAALVDALRGAQNTTDALIALLALKYDATSYRPAHSVYELTGKASDHGDLEHEYAAWRDRDGWHVRHSVRSGWGDGSAWKHTTHDVASFVEVVNADRRGINRRIAEMRAQYPTQYADAEDYPMVAPFTLEVSPCS